MKTVHLIATMVLSATVFLFAKSSDLILKSADSNINTMSKDGEVVSVLTGNVVFLYDDATIKSQYAKWWRNKGMVSFSDHVSAVRTTQTLTSDKMDYDKSKKQLISDGHVHFYDTKERVRLNGDHGTYGMDTKILVVEGKPHFVFYDTTAHDTLDITGKKMTYDDSLKKATVRDNVTIRKGKLFSHSDVAVYYPDSGVARLRLIPRIAFETDSLSGDSVDMTFTKKVLRKVKVNGNSHGMYHDYGKTDTTLTHLLGDSLSMFLSDSGKIDSLWALGNVKSKYFPIAKPYQTNEAFGKYMTVLFNKKSQVERVKVWGNAKSIYNVEEKDGRGVNEASGDSILVGFAEGRATHVKMAGSVRGFYAPLPPLAPASPKKPESGIVEKPTMAPAQAAPGQPLPAKQASPQPASAQPAPAQTVPAQPASAKDAQK
jgi:lipopolysaccharide export system protein LptA